MEVKEINHYEYNSFHKKFKTIMDKPVKSSVLPLLGFALIVILFAFLTDGKIIKASSIKLLLSQTYMLMIATTGVFLIMTMGGLDFSQGSMLGVSSITICYLSRYSIILAVIGGIITGAVIGYINGYFNVKRKIPSFIVTICSMYLLRGVCAYMTTKFPVYAIGHISDYNTVLIKISLTSSLLLVVFLVFHFTTVGSYLRAIGAGEKAARFAGIEVNKTKWLVYIIAGAITGFAAFINVVKVGSVTSTAGSQLETQILIALVLGGMPISGGAKVRFPNIIIGVLTFKILANGLVMLGLTTQMQQLIEGIIFMVVVAFFSDRKSIKVIK